MDHIPGGVEGTPFHDLLLELEKHASVSVQERCSVVSIVGRRLRKSLAELGRLFELLDGYDVLLLSESAEDLNLSFVVEQEYADEIVVKMHAALFAAGELPPLPEMPSLHFSPVLAPIHRSISRESMLGSSWTSLSSPRNQD